MGQIKISNRGFTLIELIIVMAIFITVLMITASAFNTVLTKTRVVSLSEDDNIAGVIGLEMLRHDLEQTGFGLFNDSSTTPAYTEAASPLSTASLASTYNDASYGSSIPLPLVADNNLSPGNTIVLANTDYLVIKATTVSSSPTAQKWTYITDSGGVKAWGANNFANGDKMIALQQTTPAGSALVNRKIVMDSSNNYVFTYGQSTADYTPSSGGIFYLYGVDSNSSGLSAPFNRSDYYIRRPTSGMPASCSPAAGTLYRATMNHPSGTFTEAPLLDCVADMQIVLGWNTSTTPDTDQTIDTSSSPNGAAINSSNPTVTQDVILGYLKDPLELRKRLRVIKVYILAQDGGKDLNFTNTNTNFVVGDSSLGETNLTAPAVDLTTDNMKHYRWKLYRVVVKPKNLM